LCARLTLQMQSMTKSTLITLEDTDLNTDTLSSSPKAVKEKSTKLILDNLESSNSNQSGFDNLTFGEKV